jgi:hypothetical protein
MVPTALTHALLLLIVIHGNPANFLSSPLIQTLPGVQLAPSTLNFGKQVVKKPSAGKRITVTNTGNAPLYINSATISGDNWKDFTLIKDGCSTKQIAPGRSCLITVRFTPSRIEDRNATLVLTDNAPDSPQNVTLQGTGINSIDVAPF